MAIVDEKKFKAYHVGRSHSTVAHCNKHELAMSLGNCPTLAKEIQNLPHRCMRVAQDSFTCLYLIACPHKLVWATEERTSSDHSKTESHYNQWPSLIKSELKFAPCWHNPTPPLPLVSVGMLLVMYEIDIHIDPLHNCIVLTIERRVVNTFWRHLCSLYGACPTVFVA